MSTRVLSTPWSVHRRAVLEWFVLVNLAFLALDIYIAHSVNAFHHLAEWIPFYFSLLAPFALLLARFGSSSVDRVAGFVVGWLAVAVGVAGLVFHLESSFFEQQTLRSLTYSAPFVAPLAYAGLGFLLLLNRMVPSSNTEWPKWVVLLALGGFVGNFVLAVADHAQNGFFSKAEWIPVISAAMATGFLGVALGRVSERYLSVCLVLMLAQMIVGAIGFALHGLAILKGPADDLFANVVFVSPLMAPLLFINVAALAVFGLWDLRERNQLSLSPTP